ncbi:LbetaH domain-containing protein [Pseudoalteromonas xiamenensis]
MFKNRKLRIILAHTIAYLPTNILRCSLYKVLFGYDIKQTFIGWKTIIVVDSAKLESCKIGRGNRFSGPFKFVMEANASIDKNNVFECGWWVSEPQHASTIYSRNLLLKENSLITSSHYFDLAGTIEIGRNTWIAGLHSQFWTHGAGSTKSTIFIGDDCYIGSAVRFVPGSAVGNRCLVAMSSTITKNFNIDECVIAGIPANIKKANYYWRANHSVPKK